jgi:hypothetical protein
MNLDPDKIDDAVLALLLLGATGNRAWKGLDVDALTRLHDKGFISDPMTRSQTIEFSQEGLERAQRLQSELFDRRG